MVDETAADLAARAEYRLLAALETGDRAATADAARLLTEVVDLLPGHPDVPRWCFWLGLAYSELADTGGGWDEAVGWLRRAQAGPPHPEVDPDALTEALAGTLVDRCFAAPRVTAFNRLVDELNELRGRPAGPATAGLLDYFLAVVLMSRPAGESGQEKRDEADREKVFALLDSGLPHVPDETPLLAEALAVYAEGCAFQDRFDAGLAAVARARALSGGLGEDLAQSLDAAEAELLDGRLTQADDPADRDALIAILARLVQAPDPTPYTMRRYGELLCFRGDDAESPDDLGLGVRWLEAALRAGTDEVATVWWTLGTAHRRRAALLDDPRLLDEASVCLRAALEHGLATENVDLAADAHTALVAEAVRALEAHPSSAAAVAAAVSESAAALQLLKAEDLDDGARAELALSLLLLETTVMSLRLDFDLARLDALYAQAAAHPDPPEGWNVALAHATMVRDHLEAVRREGPAGLRPFPGSPAHEILRGPVPEHLGPMVGMQLLARAAATGDRAGIESAVALLRTSDDPSAPLWIAFAEIGFLSTSDAPVEDQLAAVNRLEEAAARLDQNDPTTRFLYSSLVSPMANAVRALTGDSTPALSAPPSSPHPDNWFRATTEALGLVLQAVATAAASSNPLADRQAALHRADQAVAGLPSPEPAAVLTGHIARGWLEIAADTGDADAVERAVAWSDRTIAGLGGPDHPMWVHHASTAAAAYRRRDAPGDRDRSRELGLAVLRGHTRRVLVQSGTGHGLAVARAAVDDSQTVAAWCIEDEAFEDLVLALDAGRGLVLHAAVTTRSAAERLAGLGETELARQWADSGGIDRFDVGLATSLEGDLRRRVLDALASGSADLLDPPRVEQIRAALGEHGSDALVYLVPGDGADRPGRAVVVPAAASVEVLTLPGLAAGAGTPLEPYAEAYSAWHGGERAGAGQGGEAFDAWRAALSDLTAWAGEVAGQALLDAARRWAADPVLPRLVLVPVGALALVPWHAARCGVGREGRVPLGARAVVSYVPSARLLCRTVGATPVRAGDTLIVGNPPGSTRLRQAGREARALRDAFYPGSTFLGRRSPGRPDPDGPGTAAEVLGWLHAEPKARRVLHLACHGRAEPDDPARSRLRLADGSITLGELLGRPADATPVERVFLAACSSNVTGLDYDEAFSVATAFLAAGARTVVGSLWNVPDALTSRIMFMTHYYLAEGHSPADALHRAQLWALDPARQAPASMPDDLIAGPVGLPSDDPAGWAGLVHVGV